MARSVSGGTVKPDGTVVCRCGKEHAEVRLSSLVSVDEGFKYPRKYPFTDGGYLCDDCKKQDRYTPTMLLVQIYGDEDYEVALQRKIDEIKRIRAAAQAN